MRSRQLRCIITCFCLLLISSIFLFLSIDKLFPSNQRLNVTQSVEETFLVIVILSAGQNFHKRDTIRNTWLNLLSSNSKHLFVIGDQNIKYNLEEVKAESLKYGDILLLSNISDAYDSLTSKVLQTFVYLNKFWLFKYLLKCDDDSFVRASDIATELRMRFYQIDNLYWGFFHGSASVKKKGRWKETKWILCDHYLPYALGGGYVLSQSLVQFIANNQKFLMLFQTEDVAVGTWLAPVNVARIHDPRFDTEYISRGCSNSYLITHKHDLTNMQYFYITLKSTGNLCDTEYKLRLSYLYNWDVEPSRCCIRHNTSIP